MATGKEDFIVGEMFAFVLLVAGTLIYNEIIIVPIDIFRRNTKREKALRAQDPNRETDVV